MRLDCFVKQQDPFVVLFGERNLREGKIPLLEKTANLVFQPSPQPVSLIGESIARAVGAAPVPFQVVEEAGVSSWSAPIVTQKRSASTTSSVDPPNKKPRSSGSSDPSVPASVPTVTSFPAASSIMPPPVTSGNIVRGKAGASTGARKRDSSGRVVLSRPGFKNKFFDLKQRVLDPSPVSTAPPASASPVTDSSGSVFIDVDDSPPTSPSSSLAPPTTGLSAVSKGFGDVTRPLRRQGKEPAASGPAEDPMSPQDGFFKVVKVQSSLAKELYQPEWNVTNDFMFDNGLLCEGVVDHIATPGYFSSLRGLNNVDLCS